MLQKRSDQGYRQHVVYRLVVLIYNHGILTVGTLGGETTLDFLKMYYLLILINC